MTLIRRKLKSERGASLALALLFFAICAMVASVVLAAATAAAGRMKSLQESDQAKYSLESAAGLLQTYIEGWEYKRVGAKYKDKDHGKVYPSKAFQGVVSPIDLPSADSPCIPGFFGAVEEISNNRWGKPGYGTDPGKVTDNEELSDSTIKLVMSINGSTKNDNPVYAELTLKPDYTVYADLWICEEKKEGETTTYPINEKMPSLMMTFDSDFTETIGRYLESGRQVERTDVSVTWKTPTIILNETPLSQKALSQGGTT